MFVCDSRGLEGFVLRSIGLALKLGLRNLVRQRSRTAITFCAIALGVASLIVAGGFIKDIFIQLREAIIYSQTGHIQIFKKGFLEKGARQPERYVINEVSGVMERIESTPRLVDVAGRLNFAGLLNNGRTDLGVVGEGVEPEKEAKFGTVMRLSSGRQLADSDEYGVLIGEGVARALALGVGDHVTLVVNTQDGALNTADLEVVGIFQSFSKEYDSRAIRLPLPVVQGLLGAEGVNLFVVLLDSTDHTDGALAYIRENLRSSDFDARSWLQLSEFYERSADLYERQFGILKLIILLMVFLSVANSVNMNLFERTSEFGTMRAIGTRQRGVVGIVLVENAILGFVASLAGAGFGVLLAVLISKIGIPMPPPPNANLSYIARIVVVPSIVTESILVGVVSTVTAAIIPAIRIAKISVVDALRHAG